MTPIANFRPATAADGPFLTRMLVHAAGWRPGHDFTVERVLTEPELAHYVEGWPRQDDRGVVAELIGHHHDLPTGSPVGAAWLRYLTADDSGYGYVDDETPELIIGIEPLFRRQGIGRGLLHALAADAAAAGIERITLSVESGNGASELYRSVGYRTVSTRDDGQTMVLDLVEG
ncbi:MAG: N-acetyltransferase family protein [Acidimicrobiales bacterium]